MSPVRQDTVHLSVSTETEDGGLEALFDTVAVLVSLTTIIAVLYWAFWGCPVDSKKPRTPRKDGVTSIHQGTCSTSTACTPHAVMDITALEDGTGRCRAKVHVPYVFTSLEDILKTDIHDKNSVCEIHGGENQMKIPVKMDREEKLGKSRS